MTQQTINIGTVADDGTGDPLRTAFGKCNDNFTELYAAIAAAGASWKAPVRVATTANGTLATAFENGDTVDGVVLATGDRILIKDQSSGAENGIYVVAASGAPTRASDADAGSELLNAAVLVSEGTANADKLFICTTNAPITPGSTSLTWVNPFSGLGISTASTTEVLTGTDSAKAVTPDALAALWEQGSDVASSGTLVVGEGGHFHVTGTTTITDIDPSTDKAGRYFSLTFDGALTLTHNASTLILPGGANITTAAGDTALFKSEGSDVVRCVAYTRASGHSVATPSRQIILSLTGTALTASEVLGAIMPPTGETWTFPANLSTSSGKKLSGGVNPAATETIDLVKNGSSVGSIIISTSGVVTFATSGGTSFSLTGGTDVLVATGPASADAAVGYVFTLVATA